MKALILAAGRGSRLGPHTEALPKGFISLGGRPLIQQQLETLREAGVSEIAVVTGYRAETFADLGLTTFHNPDWAQTNMVASLWQARDWLRAGHCLVSYADILYEATLVRDLQARPEALLLPLNRHWRALWEARFANPLEDVESLRLHPDGRLAEIGQRVQSLDEVQAQFMGLLSIQPLGWQMLSAFLQQQSPQTLAHLDMTALLQAMIQAGTPIQTLLTDTDWIELDDPEDLALYQNWLPQGRLQRLCKV